MYKCKVQFVNYAPIFAEEMTKVDAEIAKWVARAQVDLFDAFDWSDGAFLSAATKRVCQSIHHDIQKLAEENGGVVDTEAVRAHVVGRLVSMTSSLDSSTSPGRNSTTTAQVKVMSDMIRGWSSDPISSAIQKAHFQEESEKRREEDRKKSWRIVHKNGKKWVTRDGWTGKPEKAEVFTYDERQSSKLGPDSRWESI